jgi:hypothetical protein
MRRPRPGRTGVVSLSHHVAGHCRRLYLSGASRTSTRSRGRAGTCRRRGCCRPPGASTPRSTTRQRRSGWFCGPAHDLSTEV